MFIELISVVLVFIGSRLAGVCLYADFKALEFTGSKLSGFMGFRVHTFSQTNFKLHSPIQARF